MKEFYAEECCEDYGVLCYQEQIRQSVTKELLEEILNLEIIKFDIIFEEETIIYSYKDRQYNKELNDSILISDFIRECYELEY